MAIGAHVFAVADNIAAYALDQALNHGVQFHGCKVVEGRSLRKLVKERG